MARRGREVSGWHVQCRGGLGSQLWNERREYGPSEAIGVGDGPARQVRPGLMMGRLVRWEALMRGLGSSL